MSFRTILLVVGLAGIPLTAGAQAPALTPAADSALAACLEALATARPDREALAIRAEQLWRAEVARHPDASAPRAGLARVLVQCRLPQLTTPDEQLGMFQEAVDEIERVLGKEPGYWPARLTLGYMYARAPSFLGLGAKAIEQLELLTSERGIPAGRTELGDALHELAEVYDRAGRGAEATATRARGRKLFPNDRRFGAPAPEAAVSMAEVTVTAASPLREASRTGKGMSALEVVTIPGGTGDLMQSLQVLPGVTGGSETSDLSLRGGDPAESPVLLNGARLVYAGKFESLNGGLFGVLDPAVLRSVRVRSGGFSARYGDALSGVIEAEAIGRPAASSRRVGLNTAGPSATVMRPLGDRGGVWASARITNTDLLLRMHGRRDEFGSAPVSVEAIAGGSRRAGRGEIQGVGLVEHDVAEPWIAAAGHAGPYRNTGTTAAAVLSGRWSGLGPLAELRVHSTVSVRASGIRFGALDLDRRLARAGVRAEADRALGATALLRAGLEAERIVEHLDGSVPAGGSFLPGSEVRVLDDRVRRAHHLGGFVEAMWFPGEGVTVTPGFRVDRLPGEQSWTGDPRLAGELRSGAFTVSLAAGVFHQGAVRPTREQPGLDERTGVPRRAHHLVVGLERRGTASVRADLYLKRTDRWAGGVTGYTPDHGTTLGGDLFVQVPGERRELQLSYGIMRGRLSVQGAGSVPSAFDVTHSLVAVAKQRIGPSWEVGMTARLSTGRPFTAVTETDDGYVLGAPNAGRYPGYQRVDARLSRYDRMGRSLLVSFVEVINVAGRANVASYGTGRSPITTFFGHRTFVLGAELR